MERPQPGLVNRVLTYALYAVFAAGFVITVTMPFMLDRYAFFINDAFYSEPGYRAFIMAFLIAVAVPSLWIVLEMIWMMRSIQSGPFIMRNVRALNRIGVIFLILAAAFLIKCMFFITLLTLLCGFLFIGGGLFAFTLAGLIHQAVVYKEENDLTI